MRTDGHTVLSSSAKSVSKSRRVNKTESINFRCYKKDKNSLKRSAERESMNLAEYVMMLHTEREKYIKRDNSKAEMRALLWDIQNEFYELEQFRDFSERIEDVCKEG